MSLVLFLIRSGPCALVMTFDIALDDVLAFSSHAPLQVKDTFTELAEATPQQSHNLGRLPMPDVLEAQIELS